MKTFISFAAFGLVAVAHAQEQCAASAAAVPTCATECIVSAGAEVGCSMGDYACQCSSSQSAAIASSALGCVLSACGPVTGLAVQGAASAVCDCVATAVPASTTPESSSAEVTTTQSSVVATTSVSISAPYPTGTASTTPAPSGSMPSASGPASGSGTVAPFVSGASFLVGSLGGVLAAMIFAMAAL
ncbi:MAG: hypothetical protein Q9216_003664 [Gyalolechia sp. 2 TL-2023]